MKHFKGPYRWCATTDDNTWLGIAPQDVAPPGFLAQELRVLSDDGREERGFTPVRAFALRNCRAV